LALGGYLAIWVAEQRPSAAERRHPDLFESHRWRAAQLFFAQLADSLDEQLADRQIPG
jgi:hypothetical protein